MEKLAAVHLRFPDQHNFEANLSDWKRALVHTRIKLKLALTGYRQAGRENLKKLNLPRYNAVQILLEEFLVDPSKYFKKIGSDKFYFCLESNDKMSCRYSACDLGEEGILEYIKTHVLDDQRNKYKITLQEFLNNEYGGTIVINDDGCIYIEFVQGFQGQIAHGRACPEFLCSVDALTGLMRYNFDDPYLRKVIYDTLMRIPHSGEGRGKAFLPGYYEFSLVKDSQGHLRPIFIDASTDVSMRNI